MIFFLLKYELNIIRAIVELLTIEMWRNDDNKWRICIRCTIWMKFEIWPRKYLFVWIKILNAHSCWLWTVRIFDFGLKICYFFCIDIKFCFWRQVIFYLKWVFFIHFIKKCRRHLLLSLTDNRWTKISYQVIPCTWKVKLNNMLTSEETRKKISSEYIFTFFWYQLSKFT